MDDPGDRGVARPAENLIWVPRSTEVLERGARLWIYWLRFGVDRTTRPRSFHATGRFVRVGEEPASKALQPAAMTGVPTRDPTRECGTTAGYSGGSAKTATYDQVTTETTGHAESVEVVYDPSKITYGQLLRIFFSVVHDPTQLNRQGPDVGTSYRSAIFYTDDEQKRIATAYIAQLDAAKVFPKPIVTQVTPLKGFYRGEDYHQDYALHHEDDPYIQVCDLPKTCLLYTSPSPRDGLLS